MEKYLARASLIEEGAEAGLALRTPGQQGAVALDAMLEAVQLPASVTDLHAGLPQMQRDDLPSHVSLGLSSRFKSRIEWSSSRVEGYISVRFFSFVLSSLFFLQRRATGVKLKRRVAAEDEEIAVGGFESS